MRGLRVTGLLLLLSGTACAADLRWIEVDGIRVVEPPPEHPRLYLRARDLDDVRRRLAHPAVEAQWQAIDAAARENTRVRIEVEARGDGTRKLLVTDLAAGTWKVWRDGQILLPAVPVSDDAGLAYFHGPMGRYTLRR